MPQRKLCLRALFILVCLPLTLSVFGQTDEQIAAQSYPQHLDDFFVNTHPPGTPVPREVTLLRVDLTNSGGDNQLVVAYSNGMVAELYLFHGAGADAVLLDQTDDPPGGRGVPVLEAIDIENDGIPEIQVSFLRETWLYKFDGGSLVLIKPSTPPTEEHFGSLGSTAYFDLDGDGKFEILESDGAASDAAYVLHQFLNGQTVKTSTEVAFYQRFEQVDGLTTKQLDFDAAPGNYVMQVQQFVRPIEGEGEPAMIEPEVTLNGTVVNGAMSSAVMAASEGPGFPVTLLSENTLSLPLPQGPDHYIYIAITRTR